MISLFVLGFPLNLNETELKDVFSNYGDVTFTRIMRDRENKASRGFGFVGMRSQHAAEAAIAALHEGELDGQVLTVKRADRQPYQKARLEAEALKQKRPRISR